MIRYVLSNLAKFHAANFAFIQQEGGNKKFREDWGLVCADAFLVENNPMMAAMFDSGTSTCMNVLKVCN